MKGKKILRLARKASGAVRLAIGSREIEFFFLDNL